MTYNNNETIVTVNGYFQFNTVSDINTIVNSNYVWELPKSVGYQTSDIWTFRSMVKLNKHRWWLLGFILLADRNM